MHARPFFMIAIEEAMPGFHPERKVRFRPEADVSNQCGIAKRMVAAIVAVTTKNQNAVVCSLRSKRWNHMSVVTSHSSRDDKKVPDTRQREQCFEAIHPHVLGEPTAAFHPLRTFKVRELAST